MIALSLIAFSKDKIEDERVQDCRLIGLSNSLLSGVMFILFSFTVDFLLEDYLENFSGVYIVILMLLLFIVQFEVLKQREF